MAADHVPRQVATSLVFEVTLYFGWWYDLAFWLTTIGLFIYKGLSLPYPNNVFWTEFVSVLLFFVVDSTRISTGSSGNKAEQLPQLVFMLLMSCPIVAFFVYFLFFQTYVLRLDQILNGTGLVFTALQMFLSLLPLAAIAGFSK